MRLSTAMAALACGAGINTASVAIQARHRLLTRWFGDHAWHAHLVLITPAYVWFVLSLICLEHGVRWPLPWRFRGLGAMLIAGAATVWGLAYRQLGPKRTANGYFFGITDEQPVRAGVFKWLRNPMYDSYVAALAGLALLSGNAAYLALAAEAFVAFNIVEARVENRPFDHANIGLANGAVSHPPLH